MNRLPILGILAGCLAATSYAATREGNADNRLLISIKVCEEVEDGARTRVITNPALVATLGRPLSYKLGGELDNGLFFGSKVTGSIESVAGGVAQIELRISVSSHIPQKAIPSTQVVRSEVIDVHSSVNLGETIRLDCSQSQWCEVTVTAMESFE